MQHSNIQSNPLIIFSQYSPYMIVDLEEFTDAKGVPLKIERVMSLCRCGKSKYKPYCDGSHAEAQFVGNKDPERTPDRIKEYAGKDITIVDNRGVCAHDGACVNNSPTVFFKDTRPWINPNGASVKEIIATIEMCPSGALSYKIGSKRYQDLDRDPMIFVAKNGPLEVRGNITIIDDLESVPECQEHFTLCRCGESKNKPFCDGSHDEADFDDSL